MPLDLPKYGKYYPHKPKTNTNSRMEDEKYREWRTNVCIKHKHKCFICNHREHKVAKRYIQAHHIKNYSQASELRHDVDNGVAICNKCHREFHNKYGLLDNNESQLMEFKEIKGKELKKRQDEISQKARETRLRNKQKKLEAMV